MRELPQKRGIVLYDHLLVKGGAERVSLLLANELAAELAVGFRQRELFPESELGDLILRDLGVSVRANPMRYISVLRAFASRGQFQAPYDWALYGGACAPVAVVHHSQSYNVYYCHALPSFAYEWREFYLAELPAPARPLLRALASWLRPRYEEALGRMNRIIANSAYTQRLLKEYLELESSVIHPPVDIGRFCWQEPGDYYLSTARIEPHKRVDLIIDAFRHMPDKKLVVAGGGRLTAALERKATEADNIRFVGWCDAEQMQHWLGRCIASIYLAKAEPFGISPVESMAAGKPVIGAAEGGLLETVVSGSCGLLIKGEPTVESLIETVEALPAERALAMRHACEARARLFSQRRFVDQVREVLAIR